jgi:hypothetical protein
MYQTRLFPSLARPLPACPAGEGVVWLEPKRRGGPFPPSVSQRTASPAGQAGRGQITPSPHSVTKIGGFLVRFGFPNAIFWVGTRRGGSNQAPHRSTLWRGACRLERSCPVPRQENAKENRHVGTSPAWTLSSPFLGQPPGCPTASPAGQAGRRTGRRSLGDPGLAAQLLHLPDKPAGVGPPLPTIRDEQKKSLPRCQVWPRSPDSSVRDVSRLPGQAGRLAGESTGSVR